MNNSSIKSGTIYVIIKKKRYLNAGNPGIDKIARFSYPDSSRKMADVIAPKIQGKTLKQT